MPENGSPGAFSGRGRLFVDANGQLVLLWEEGGTTSARRPSSDELSNIIIRRNIPHALGGEAEISQRENGLKATSGQAVAEALKDALLPHLIRAVLTRLV